ncbi:terpenoid synthase [Neoconidiobolus thromboides FSU 785]|nr:terpenoid synthase [Neoconidiobolus thromboides FSU 785]
MKMLHNASLLVDGVQYNSELRRVNSVYFRNWDLLRLGIKMMQQASNPNVDYMHLVNLLGEHHQIRDDYVNLKAEDYHSAKVYCQDLSEGKYSFPIIHSLRTGDNIHQLENVLKQRTENINLKELVLLLMEKINSFKYTKAYLNQLLIQIQDLVSSLNKNDLLFDIINKLKFWPFFCAYLSALLPLYTNQYIGGNNNNKFLNQTKRVVSTDDSLYVYQFIEHTFDTNEPDAWKKTPPQYIITSDSLNNISYASSSKHLLIDSTEDIFISFQQTIQFVEHIHDVELNQVDIIKDKLGEHDQVPTYSRV